MSRNHKDREGAYVLRFDGFHSPQSPPDVTVTVKEVVRTQEIAEAEVNRLNALHVDGRVKYWGQYIRLYPEGQSAELDSGMTDQIHGPGEAEPLSG
jgi:hypothetical protein